MESSQIQIENDRAKLYARLEDKDLRKKERRLIGRRIRRIEAEALKKIKKEN